MWIDLQIEVNGGVVGCRFGVGGDSREGVGGGRPVARMVVA